MTGLGDRLLSVLVGDAEIAGFFSDEAEIAAMLRVEAALAESQAEAGLIAAAAGARIADGCLAFQPDWTDLATGLALDGVVVPELVRQLRAAVGPPHAEDVHFGATSQDIVDTGLMLRLKAVCEILARRVQAVQRVLEVLRQRDGATPLMAVTRMQAALPFTGADKIATWAAPLGRHGERLARLAEQHFAVQLGGPIGIGQSQGDSAHAVREGLARRLGLADTPAWHAERDRIADIGHVLASVSGTLGKIGQDLALMSQTGIGTVALAGGGGSSAMAHKSNPVGAEVLVALARLNAGLVGTLHQSMVHENERSGTAWTLEWMVLPQMAVATAAGLAHALRLVVGMRFVPKP